MFIILQVSNLILIQFGSINSDGYVTVNLPIMFNNTSYSLSYSRYIPTTYANVTTYANYNTIAANTAYWKKTLTSFEVRKVTDSGCTAYTWIALGY